MNSSKTKSNFNIEKQFSVISNNHQHNHVAQFVSQKEYSLQSKICSRDNEEKKVDELVESQKENFLKESLPNEETLQAGSPLNFKTPQDDPSSSLKSESSYEEEKEDEEEKGDLISNEGIMNVINDHHINPIMLLNTIKMKKKVSVEYEFKEKVEEKLTFFECVCLFKGLEIGSGKKKSKDEAKREAANNACRVLVSKEIYQDERAEIFQDIKKFLRKNSANSDGEKKDPSDVNQTPLYLLNHLKNCLGIKPLWKRTQQNAIRKLGRKIFVEKLLFDSVRTQGISFLKRDARHNAAAKFLKQLLEDHELAEKYKLSGENLKLLKETTFFISFNEEKLVNFNNFLEERNEEMSINGETFEFLQQTVQLLQDYSSMITSKPKQVLIDAPVHPADYISDFSLAPIGSFALDCMRKDKLTVDLLASFTRTQEISNEEFLKLFCAGLKECNEENLGKDKKNLSKINFNVEKENSSIEIRAKHDSIGEITFRIKISEYPSIDQNPAIIHIKSINDCFKETDRSFGNFRVLMSLMRSWREKNKLFFLPPEILDIVLLSEFFSNNIGNFAYYIVKVLSKMSSDKDLMAALEKFGPDYVQLYQSISEIDRQHLHNECLKIHSDPTNYKILNL